MKSGQRIISQGSLPAAFGVAAFFVAMIAAPCAMGQSAVDISVGFGTNHASATGAGIDNTTFNSCAVNSGISTCQATPSLSGLFMGLGGDIMFKDHFGAGFQYNFQPAKQDYGPLQYRQSFIDVNGIFAPVNRKKWLVQLIGGIGAAKTSFAYTQTSCVANAVCASQTSALGNSNHFAVHAGVALQYFVWDKIFIKPQFDYHYVPNLTDQFGGNSVPGAMISIGYGSSRQ